MQQNTASRPAKSRVLNFLILFFLRFVPFSLRRGELPLPHGLKKPGELFRRKAAFPHHTDDVGVLKFHDLAVDFSVAGLERGDFAVVLLALRPQPADFRVHIRLLSERSGRRYAPVSKEMGLPV